jgi:deoxyribonuclease V
MRPVVDHSWDITPSDAVRLQRELAARVSFAPLGSVRTVAGVDVSVRDGRVRASIVVMEVDRMAVVEHVSWEGPVVFPYVPGLLSFREMPAIIPAMSTLTTRPDVFMLDAHGTAHPRRFGLACHLGVVFDVPAIGVAKTRLTGKYREPGHEKGDASDLVDGDEVIGRVLRTRGRIKPVFVSTGHRATLEDAAALTLTCCTRYKLPEPTRLAHRLSKEGAL